MKTEETKITELKVGEIYNVRVKVCFKETSRVLVRAIDKNGNAFDYCPNWFAAAETVAFSPTTPENGKKNAAPSPKYDPCRKFRKGDIVRLREYNGRPPYDYWHKQVIKNFGAKLDTVLEDEKDSGNVDIFQDAPIDELTVRVNSCHLELVTPVEERVRYRVGDFPTNNEWCVWKDSLSKTEVVSSYKIDTHPHAKEAAEAECARLNEEYRKEVEK